MSRVKPSSRASDEAERKSSESKSISCRRNAINLFAQQQAHHVEQVEVVSFRECRTATAPVIYVRDEGSQLASSVKQEPRCAPSASRSRAKTRHAGSIVHAPEHRPPCQTH